MKKISQNRFHSHDLLRTNLVQSLGLIKSAIGSRQEINPINLAFFRVSPFLDNLLSSKYGRQPS